MKNCIPLVDLYFSIFHSVRYRRCLFDGDRGIHQLALFVLLLFCLYETSLLIMSLDLEEPYRIPPNSISYCVQLTVYIVSLKPLVAWLVATYQVDSTDGGSDTTTHASASDRYRADIYRPAKCPTLIVTFPFNDYINLFSPLFIDTTTNSNGYALTTSIAFDSRLTLMKFYR